jgi:hypothetical protein
MSKLVSKILKEALDSKAEGIFTGAVWSGEVDGQYDQIVININGDGKIYGQGTEFDFLRDTPQEAYNQLKQWGYKYSGVE